jgi:hypothetical protein
MAVALRVRSHMPDDPPMVHSPTLMVDRFVLDCQCFSPPLQMEVKDFEHLLAVDGVLEVREEMMEDGLTHPAIRLDAAIFHYTPTDLTDFTCGYYVHQKSRNFIEGACVMLGLLDPAMWMLLFQEEESEAPTLCRTRRPRPRLRVGIEPCGSSFCEDCVAFGTVVDPEVEPSLSSSVPFLHFVLVLTFSSSTGRRT